MSKKNKITNEWRSWIATNLDRGISKDVIFNTLVDHGYSYNAVAREMRYEPHVQHLVPEDWKTWVKDNISLGHDKDGLFKVLLINGFSYDSIKQLMQYEPSVPLDQLENPFTTVKPNYALENKNLLPLSIPNAIKLDTHKLEIFYMENFLSDFECSYLLKIIKNKLLPSKLASPEQDDSFRTSQTCDLAMLDDDIVNKVDNKICKLLGLENNASEPIQGQFYKVGQEFKPHTDYFEHNELKTNGGTLGQRTYTVMVYLNSTKAGGETTFPLINQEFIPKKGNAVIWSSLNLDLSPNKYSLHHAKKVRSGYKAVITKWFRTGIPIY